MKNLEELKIAVHEKGFNISMMINTFKKKQKLIGSLREIPDSILCEVCEEYLMRLYVKKGFPYFMKVLSVKIDQYYANRVQKEHKEKNFGKMPSNIKEALRGALGV